MPLPTTAPPEAAPQRRKVRRWPDRIGLLAAGWAACYAVIALIWTLTGTGYPYEQLDDLTLMRLLPVDAGPPVFAGVLLTTAVAAFAVAGPQAVRLRGLPRTLLLAYGWLVAGALLLVVPDVEPLVITGYSPMLIIGAPFGWPPVDYSTIFDYALLHKVIALAGGVLLAWTLVVWRRRTVDACVVCGRHERPRAWTSASSARRWGRWAAYVAAAIPLGYATVRLAWLLGIPLGIDRAFLDEMHETGLVYAGAGLGGFAIVGSILTLGLVHRWGERFPRWIPGLAGRRVPIKLAVIPATFVTIAVAAGSLAMLSHPVLSAGMIVGDGTSAPMVVWPLWSVALGLAAYAYYLRRRSTCTVCGRA